jgi:hypothetical protein
MGDVVVFPRTLAHEWRNEERARRVAERAIAMSRPRYRAWPDLSIRSGLSAAGVETQAELDSTLVRYEACRQSDQSHHGGGDAA